MTQHHGHRSFKLPFFYGWLIVGIAFVTMAIGVSAHRVLAASAAPDR